MSLPHARPGAEAEGQRLGSLCRGSVLPEQTVQGSAPLLPGLVHQNDSWKRLHEGWPLHPANFSLSLLEPFALQHLGFPAAGGSGAGLARRVPSRLVALCI